MQGSWGWDPQEEAHVSGASNKDWQGQWETNKQSNRSPHWESDNWNSWNTNGSFLNNEFENILTWDDSGALEALCIANERYEALSRGLKYPTPLPDPDLYIQSIDWDRRDSFESKDSGEVSSEIDGNGQRKRSRRGFKGDKRGNKQFNKQDYDQSSDWRGFKGDTRGNKQFNKQGYDGSSDWRGVKGDTRGNKQYDESSDWRGFKGDTRGNKQFNKQEYDESSDWRQRNRLASIRGQPQAESGWGRDIHKGSSKVETSRQEMYHNAPHAERQVRYSGERYHGAVGPTFVERPTHWGHTERPKNPQESHWRPQMSYDYSPQNHYNHRWKQPNISADIPQGLSSPAMKGLHGSPQGVNSHSHNQAGWASSGNEWAWQYESNDRARNPYGQSSRGQRHLHPTVGPW